HVLHKEASVNPDQVGTKASLWYELSIPAGETAQIRLRFSDGEDDLGASFDATMRARKQEADDFYATLTPEGCPPDEAMVMRQAFAGMLWGKQFYHYDVDRWLEGDPAQPSPPSARRQGRNATWMHLNNHDVISMPD